MLKESEIKKWCSINSKLQDKAFDIAKKYYEIMEIEVAGDYEIEVEFYDVCSGKETISVYMTVRNDDWDAANHARELVIPYSDFCGDYETWIRIKMADVLKEKEVEKNKIAKEIRDSRFALYLKLKEEFKDEKGESNGDE